MAAPNGIVWGSIAGGYGRIGIYVKLTNTATQTTRHTEIWFWSKYSVSDTGNTFYYDDNATSAVTSKGAVSISTTVDSGSGWSTSNQVKLKEYDYTFTRGTSSLKRYVSAKLTGVDRVGATMTVSTNYTIPSLASYTIKYNANGGSGAPNSQTKYYGKTLALSSVKPTRTGYTFQGWSTSASGNVVYASGVNYTENASVTLYAVWKSVTYTVKYNANGGSGVPSNQTKTYGKTLTLSSVIPTRTSVEDNGTLTEYIFKGWSTSASSTNVVYKSGSSYTANASITLYAVWSKTVSTSMFDVSYNTNGGSEVISQIKINGKTLKLRNTIPVKNGYTFTGWGLSADSTTVSYYAGDNYTSDEDIVLYAIWTPWNHTVVFDANGGSGDIPKSFVKATDKDDIIIPDCSLTNEKYIFKYWCTKPSGSGGTNYYAGDGYSGIKDGGTVTLYAIWDTRDICLYMNGDCKASEFIEDNSMSFNNDGTIHYVEFIEGNSSINLDFTGFYVKELLERVVVCLTDESDAILVDEFGNCLTTII